RARYRKTRRSGVAETTVTCRSTELEVSISVVGPRGLAALGAIGVFGRGIARIRAQTHGLRFPGLGVLAIDYRVAGIHRALAGVGRVVELMIQPDVRRTVHPGLRSVADLRLVRVVVDDRVRAGAVGPAHAAPHARGRVRVRVGLVASGRLLDR